MPWMAVDDQMHGHRKFLRLGVDRLPATGLWTTAGSWSAGNMTDGFVPDYVAMQWDPDLRLSLRLVAVGLWVEDKVGTEQGFRFHQWESRNSSREEIEAKRADAAERKRRSRERRRQGDGTFGPDPSPEPDDPDDDGPGGGVTFETSHAPVTDESHVTSQIRPHVVTRESLHSPPFPPLPSPPTPTEEHSTDAGASALFEAEPQPKAPKAKDTPRYSAAFETFWDACPRKVGKAAAAKAFVKACRGGPLREGESRATTLTHRMRVMAAYWEAAGTEERFIVHPSRWLNEGRFEDPPPRLPSRVPAVRDGYPAAAGDGPTYNGVRPSGRIPTTTQRVADIMALKELFPE